MNTVHCAHSCLHKATESLNQIWEYLSDSGEHMMEHHVNSELGPSHLLQRDKEVKTMDLITLGL